MKELILGGVRSGKSRLAEQRAMASGLMLTYIATATADDAEMRLRVAEHRRRRSDAWALVEEPRALASVLRAHAAVNRFLGLRSDVLGERSTDTAFTQYGGLYKMSYKFTPNDQLSLHYNRAQLDGGKRFDQTKRPGNTANGLGGNNHACCG